MRYIGEDGQTYDDGAVNIVGGVGLTIVGGPPNQRNMQVPRRGAPLAHGPQGVQVHGSAYQDHTQELLLSFQTKTIPAHGSATMEATPQEAIRFQRLVMDQASGVSGSLTVTEIKVGSIPQDIGSGGAAPFSMFGPTAINTQLRGKTCNIGQKVSVTLANSSAGDIDVSGALTGESLRTA